MIITASPRVTQILREVWKPLAVLFVWDVIVTVTYYVLPFKAPKVWQSKAIPRTAQMTKATMKTALHPSTTRPAC